MAGKITALLMAILIAAPFCCCVANAAAETPAKEAHACCHKEKAAPDAPEAPGPCDCGDESSDQWVLAGESKPALPQWMLLTEFSWERLFESAASAGRDARRAIISPEAVSPPGRVLSQVHCRYLL